MGNIREIYFNNHLLKISTKERLSSENLLFLLHGLGCSKDCFGIFFESNELKDYSLCSLDWVGFGESDKPQDFSYSLEDQAKLGLEILKQIPHKQVNIIAHSMGGGIGLIMAQQIQNLGYFISLEGLLGGGAYSKRIAGFSEGEFINQQHKIFLKELKDSSQPALKLWAEWYKKASPHALYKSSKSMVAWAESGKLFDLLNRLPQKAYLYGDNDNIEDLLPRFNNVEIHHVKNSGHFFMQDQPGQLSRKIQQILAQA